jgi:hypothetical protein
MTIIRTFKRNGESEAWGIQDAAVALKGHVRGLDGPAMPLSYREIVAELEAGRTIETPTSTWRKAD